MARKIVQISTVKTGASDYTLSVVALDSEGGVWVNTAYNGLGNSEQWQGWQALPGLPEDNSQFEGAI